MHHTFRYMARVLATAALLVSAATASAQVTELTADLAEYSYPGNRPQSPPNFTYAPDGNGYLMLSDDKRTVDRYDLATGKKTETLFDASRTRETTVADIEGFSISADGRYMLLWRDSKPVYRRSFTACYYVYEVRTRILAPLSADHPRQQAAVLSPDGLMVAFMAGNDIYIRKNVYNSQVQVTRDGAPGSVINGVPDWVYEEEFSTSCSMVFSPDNLMLCYLRYDESQVGTYLLPRYQGTCDPDDSYALYPGTYSYKYPVAGTPNSKVTLHSYDIETRKTLDLKLPDSNIEYIPRIDFGGSAERLMVPTLNRDQNRLEIYCVNPRSTVARSVYTDVVKDGWVQEESYTSISYDADRFTVMSGRSGWNRYYQYSYAGQQLREIGMGQCDITACYGTDAQGNIYIQAASPTPMDRVVYRIGAKGAPQAITATGGTNAAVFSPGMTHAMLSHSDTKTPPVYTLATNTGKALRTLQDNKAYAARYADLPAKEFFTMTSDGETLNGYIIRGAGADKSHPSPVIMSQYSGPGSQQVLNRWSVDWEQYYAMRGYTVVCVDGRGTGGRGTAFMYKVYKDLGRYETIDQVNAARHAASLPYTDGSRVGIYGWSYGGYEALMAASAPNAPYKAAVAIAPVTDWRYYDTVYTERFMLTPQQNESGYRASAPIQRTRSLSCPTLLMYGTADDNVHPVNTLQYVSTLQSQGGVCDMFVFPNMNHSIYGCNARSVVYAKMLDFFNKNL